MAPGTALSPRLVLMAGTTEMMKKPTASNMSFMVHEKDSRTKR